MVIKKIIKDEWLFILAFFGMLSTSLYLHRFPLLTRTDVELLYVLFLLFIATSGLEQHGTIAMLADKLQAGRFIAIKMVGGTFFFSMLVTNDVALTALIPLTLLLQLENTEWLVILEILAANAGSALSPFGNPQNLFIYWYYQVPFGEFLKTIGVFSATFFVLLIFAAFLLDRREKSEFIQAKRGFRLSKSDFIYVCILIFAVLIVLRVLPLSGGLFIILYVLLFDRKSLKIDYVLLATFACFFGFTDNLEILLSGVLAHPHHVFLLSALLSQIISNVPTTLLLANFTTHWRALLWGVSTGGFGSLVASLANLIAYRIYVKAEKQKALSFTLKFHALSYGAFFIALTLYAILYIAL